MSIETFNKMVNKLWQPDNSSSNLTCEFYIEDIFCLPTFTSNFKIYLYCVHPGIVVNKGGTSILCASRNSCE